MYKIKNQPQFGAAHKKRRVLVHLLGSLGDCLISIPAMRAIRRHFGDGSELTIMHETRGSKTNFPKEVIGSNIPVDGFYGYPIGKTKRKKILNALFVWGWLCRHRFTDVVSLMPSERLPDQIKRDQLFFSLAGIPIKYGFHKFSKHLLYPRDALGNPGRTMHEAWFYLRRLELSGICTKEESDLQKPFFKISAFVEQKAKEWLKHRGWDPSMPLVAIGPGAKKPVSHWSLERFEEIGRRLLEHKRYKIVIVGGEAERQAGNNLVAKLPGTLNAAGSFDVLGSAAILKYCNLLIGLDTGSTHLAAFMGIPCVALYSGVDHPGRWDLLGEGHHILRKVVPCSPCQVLFGACPIIGHPCMNQISVDEVWEYVRLSLKLTSRN